MESQPTSMSFSVSDKRNGLEWAGSSLDTLFEGSGGLDGQYNVYTVDLASVFGLLSDGIATVALNLDGPGLVTPLFPLPGPNPPVETTTNGANLIYSTLSIETRDSGEVPLPGSLSLVLLALLLLLWHRHQSRPLALARTR